MAQQTTLSVEVAHFTQDEHNILHRGPTWLAGEKTALQTLIPVNGLRVKEGHIKI